MQRDSNRDLHPCAYHSATFSLAEQNYDIYDRELMQPSQQCLLVIKPDEGLE